MLTINTSWGLDDGSSLVGEIERLFDVVEPGGKEKKLSDVSGLHIVVADLNAHETVVCSGKNYPNMRVVDAVRASMSLPIMFRPYKHPENGHYWVDGAVRAHFPWGMLPDDSARAESLGFTFEKSWVDGPKTFMEYLFSMIHFDEPKKMMELKQKWPHNIVVYPSPPFPAWFVKFKQEDYDLVKKIGQEAADRWFTLTSVQEMPETQILCDRPHTLPRFHHRGPANGSLETQKPLPIPESVSLRAQESRLSSRRWSV
jgi:hypothetical protein